MKLNTAASALVLSALASGLSACGMSPLTAEQKATVKAVGHSGISAQKNASPANVGMNVASTVNLLSAMTRPGSSTSEPISDSEKAYAIRLERAKETQCEVDTADSGVRGPVSQLQSTFKVSGSNCPIFMEMKSDSEGQFTLVYRVIDPELKKLNDVDQLNLKAELDAGENSGKFTFKIEGDLNSQKHGQVRFKFEISVSEANVQFVVRYDFKDFAAEGKLESSANGPKYTVNGETVTQEEFFNLMVSGFVGGNGNGSNRVPSAPSSPPTAPPQFPG